MHHRRFPVDNRFVYTQGYVMFDICLFKRKASYQGLNIGGGKGIFQVPYHRYGRRLKGEDPSLWYNELLKKHVGDLSWLHKTVLVTQPQVFGMVFNPVSFWVSLDQQEKPRVMVAEVNNTFRQSHSYVVHRPDFSPISPQDRIQGEKVFHVSPFYEREGDYVFQLNAGAEKFSVSIDYEKTGNSVFKATLCGRFLPLRCRALFLSLIPGLIPSLKTPILIHYQALKLWSKKVPFTKTPAQSKKRESSCSILQK